MKKCRYNRVIALKREVSPINLYISAAEGYLVTFPDSENAEALINAYKGRLRDLGNNI